MFSKNSVGAFECLHCIRTHILCTCLIVLASADKCKSLSLINISTDTWLAFQSLLGQHSIDISVDSQSRDNLFSQAHHRVLINIIMYNWVSWHSANYWLHVEISDEWPLRYWSSAKSIDLHSTADAFGLVHMIPWPYGARALKHHFWLKNGSLLQSLKCQRVSQKLGRGGGGVEILNSQILKSVNAKFCACPPDKDYILLIPAYGWCSCHA